MTVALKLFFSSQDWTKKVISEYLGHKEKVVLFRYLLTLIARKNLEHFMLRQRNFSLKETSFVWFPAPTASTPGPIGKLKLKMFSKMKEKNTLEGGGRGGGGSGLSSPTGSAIGSSGGDQSPPTLSIHEPPPSTGDSNAWLFLVFCPTFKPQNSICDIISHSQTPLVAYCLTVKLPCWPKIRHVESLQQSEWSHVNEFWPVNKIYKIYKTNFYPIYIKISKAGSLVTTTLSAVATAPWDCNHQLSQFENCDKLCACSRQFPLWSTMFEVERKSLFHLYINWNFSVASSAI